MKKIRDWLLSHPECAATQTGPIRWQDRGASVVGVRERERSSLFFFFCSFFFLSLSPFHLSNWVSWHSFLLHQSYSAESTCGNSRSERALSASILGLMWVLIFKKSQTLFWGTGTPNIVQPFFNLLPITRTNSLNSSVSFQIFMQKGAEGIQLSWFIVLERRLVKRHLSVSMWS